MPHEFDDQATTPPKPNRWAPSRRAGFAPTRLEAFAPTAGAPPRLEAFTPTAEAPPRLEAFAPTRRERFAPPASTFNEQDAVARYRDARAFVLNAAKLSAEVVLTTAVVSAIQTPVTALLFHQKQTGKYSLPSTGMAATVRFLSKGYGANAASGGLRSAYSLNVKKSTTTAEHNVDEAPNAKNTAKSVVTIGSIAAGEQLVTVSNTLSDLRKTGVLPADFNWKKNAWPLLKIGAGAKFISLNINYGCLLLVEDKVSGAIPIQNPQLNHFFSGALSGALAAVVAFPANTYRDRAVLDASVKDGQLIPRSTARFFNETRREIQAKRLVGVSADFLRIAGQELPLRIFRSGTTFGTICLMGALLGNEPKSENDSIPTPKYG